MALFINKIGLEHALAWRNCQDYGFIQPHMKCVVDGCSEGDHSDIGATLFCQLFQKNESIDETFAKLTELFSDFDAIKHHLLFTILYVTEDDAFFTVHTAGDGVIIKQQWDDTLEYEVIDQDNRPSYYAYNYVPKDYLKKYQTGVAFETRCYSKTDYKNIGVATDGLMYLLGTPFQAEFERYLLCGKENRIKLLLNKLHRNSILHTLQNKTYPEPLSLKDDITIAF